MASNDLQKLPRGLGLGGYAERTEERLRTAVTVGRTSRHDAISDFSDSESDTNYNTRFRLCCRLLILYLAEVAHRLAMEREEKHRAEQESAS